MTDYIKLNGELGSLLSVIADVLLAELDSISLEHSLRALP